MIDLIKYLNKDPLKYFLHTLDENIKIKALGRPMLDLKLTRVIKKKNTPFYAFLFIVFFN